MNKVKKVYNQILIRWKIFIILKSFTPIAQSTWFSKVRMVFEKSTGLVLWYPPKTNTVFILNNTIQYTYTYQSDTITYLWLESRVGIASLWELWAVLGTRWLSIKPMVYPELEVILPYSGRTSTKPEHPALDQQIAHQFLSTRDNLNSYIII